MSYMRGQASPELAEVINILSEECSEAIKEVCKINRFGLHNRYPTEQDPSNIENLTAEIADVLGVILVLQAKYPHIFKHEQIASGITNKIAKLKKYVKHLEDFDLDKALEEIK